MPNKEEFNGFDDDIFSPDDFIDEEETPVEETTEDESETDDKVERVETEENSSQPTEETDEQVKTQEELDVEKKTQTDAERNSHYAKLRREREAKEREQREKEIREAAKLEAQLEMVKTNPYTNEVIRDEEDLKIYKLQKTIEDKGGDPLSDLPKALAEENRRLAQERKAQTEKEKSNQQRLADEANELFAKYPETAGKAQDDQELLDLIRDKDGRWTMTDCYEYLLQKRQLEKVKKQVAEKEKKKGEVVNEVTNKYHKIPSSQSNGGKVSQNVLDMTDEEYLRLKKEETKDDFF